MESSLLECPGCRQPFNARLMVCPFCGARRDASGAGPAAAEPARPRASAGDPGAEPGIPPAPGPVQPEKPACPNCGGEPGPGTVTIETREWKDTSILTGTSKYLVRTVEVPGLCGGCSSGLHARRFVADLLCLVPLVGLFLIGVIADSGFFIGCTLFYALYLVGKLGYNWADLVMYGAQLGVRLMPFVPAGDTGSTRFPVGFWHCLVRVGALPGAFAMLGLLVGSGLLGTPRPRASTPSPSASAESSRTPDTRPADQVASFHDLLTNARDLAVPLSPATFVALQQAVARKGPGNVKAEDVELVVALHPRAMGGRTLNELVAYADPSAIPAGTTYQPMSGPQLAAHFSRTQGADMLVIVGAGPTMALPRARILRLLPELPKPGPLAIQVVRKP